MRYVSTRSTAPGKGFSDILLEGLAADGGLYLPETYPQVSTETLEQWRALLAERGLSFDLQAPAPLMAEAALTEPHSPTRGAPDEG